MTDRERRPEGHVLEKTKRKTQRPTLYKVILHNDDYTTMEFVVHVLENIYQKSPAEAYGIMMQVHLSGAGICGAYPLEIGRRMRPPDSVGQVRRLHLGDAGLDTWVAPVLTDLVRRSTFGVRRFG